MEAGPERPLTDSLFDLLPVAIYICDPDGLVLFYNRQAAELWGRSLFDFQFLAEFAAGGVGTSNRRHSFLSR
jgi:PAS domain-containing protein